MKKKHTDKNLPKSHKDKEFINHYIRNYEFSETLIISKSDLEEKQVLSFEGCVFHEGLVFENIDSEDDFLQGTFSECIFKQRFSLNEVFRKWGNIKIGTLIFDHCHFEQSFEENEDIYQKLVFKSISIKNSLSEVFSFSWNLEIGHLNFTNAIGNYDIKSTVDNTFISYDDSIKDFYNYLLDTDIFLSDWDSFLDIEKDIQFDPESYKEISVYQFFESEVTYVEAALMNIDLWLNLYSTKDEPGSAVIDGYYYKVSIYGPIKNLDLTRVFSQTINIHGVSRAEQVKLENIRALTNDSTFIISSSNLENSSFFNVEFDSFKYLSIYKSNIESSFFSQCTFGNKIYSFDVDDMERGDNHAKYDSYRQLKSALLKSNNLPDALKMHSKMYDHYRKLNGIGFWNRIILFFNRISNKHGISWSRGVLFTMIFGFLGFYAYRFSLNESIPDFETNLKHYLLFLYPAHSFDFMQSYDPTVWSYLIDFISRIFIGYGYYQTIQAFRKFGKL